MSRTLPLSRTLAALLVAILVAVSHQAAAQDAPARDTSTAADTARAPSTVPLVRLDGTGLGVPHVDPLRELAGKVPGALVVGTSGRPGASPGVLLGGVRSPDPSLSSQVPLYLVDGIVVYAGMPVIEAEDIARIDVVTGSLAAPLHGSRAANGVIEVTTRSGTTSARAFSLRLRTEAGSSDLERTFAPAAQHALLTDATGTRFCVADPAAPLCARSLDWTAETARVNAPSGGALAPPQPLAFDPGAGIPTAALRQAFVARYWPVPVYDDVRQATRSAPLVRSSADVTGRVGGTGYYASVSRTREGSAFRLLDGATRYSGRVNLDQRIGRNLSVSVRTFYGHGRSDGLSQEGVGTLFFWLTRQPASADLLARNPLGLLDTRPNILTLGGQYGNPLLYTTGNGVTDLLETERLLGGASLGWTPLPWLEVTASAGYDRRTDRWDYGVPLGFLGPDGASASAGDYETDRWRDETRTADVGASGARRIGRDLSVAWSVRLLTERHESAVRQEQWTVGSTGTPPPIITSRTTTVSAPQRATGLATSARLTYKERLAADLLLRRDRYTLGDSHPRATMARLGLAYRLSEEPWWPLAGPAGELSLRASIGRNGTAPTYGVSSGDLLSALPAAPGLRGPTIVAHDVGADLEIFHRVGIAVTYAASETRDLVAPVPLPATTGFGFALGNVGSLRNRTWELAVDVPIVRRRDLAWSWRLAYDRSRAVFGRMAVPPFAYGGTETQFGQAALIAREGERYGTLYGYDVLRGAADCAKLPAPFRSDCGTPNSSFQVNSDGYLVWVGKDPAGNAYHVGDGLARNLWMTRLPAAQAPWGYELSWGMLIPYRDSTGARQPVPLGTALPDWHLSVSQDLRWGRVRVYALLEAVIGRDVWNVGRHWSYVDLTNAEVDQRGVDPALAKPVGYYYRSGPPESSAGIGGLYQTLAPYNGTVEDASFAKLRELSITWHVGAVGGIGSWEISLIGRNVLTLTHYHGPDPEIGISGGPQYPTTVNATDAFTFPNLRTLALALSTAF